MMEMDCCILIVGVGLGFVGGVMVVVNGMVDFCLLGGLSECFLSLCLL